MLIATGQLLPEQVQNYATVGELALDGSVHPVKGALAMAMAAAERKVPRMLVPAANVREAAVVEEVAVYPVSILAEAAGIVSGTLVVEPTPSNMDEFFGRVLSYDVDFNDVRGQEFAKRALVTAASGGPQRPHVVANFSRSRGFLGIFAFRDNTKAFYPFGR